MKRFIALGLAAVVAVSLSGCTVFNTFMSAGDEAVLSSELDVLSEDLQKVPGIDSVDYDLVLQPDLSYAVSVNAFATDLPERGALDAIALVTATFKSPRFPEQSALAFSVGPAGDGSSPAISILTWLEFPTEVISEEVEYFYDVQEAAGAPLAMQLDAPGDMDVNYQRFIYSPVLPASIDWLAMRRIADTGAELTAWDFGGISMSGGIIPNEIEDVATEAAAIEGVALSWSDEFGIYDLTLTPVDPEFAGNFTELIVWTDVVALLENASAGSDGLSLFGVTANQYGATVNFNDCGFSPEPTEPDIDLERVLEAEGVIVEPGYC